MNFISNLLSPAGNSKSLVCIILDSPGMIRDTCIGCSKLQVEIPGFRMLRRKGLNIFKYAAEEVIDIDIGDTVAGDYYWCSVVPVSGVVFSEAIRLYTSLVMVDLPEASWIRLLHFAWKAGMSASEKVTPFASAFA